eukprot:TRINITY_DN7663_c0_g1_i11.p1 TRINITY_DN7663_c0_g1~~TRINITY_DN7663_c0_g1_i11.p1  ORF type:complete len:682 (+),score=85.78 TRINITY_DN7663_c0_g1_i11:562-2607(+)
MNEIGRKHATSKLSSIDQLSHVSTFGYRGEAIFSIAEHSTIEITSRRKSSYSTFTKTIKTGNHSPVSRSAQPRNQGTTVTVKDFCSTIPVRRNTWPSASAQIEKIRDFVIRTAVAHPDLSISLYEDSRQSRICQLKPRTDFGEGFLSVFGLPRDRFVQVKHKAGELSLEGVITSLESVNSTKPVQMIFVNRRLMKYNKAYKALNELYFKLKTSSLTHMMVPSDNLPHGLDEKQYDKTPCYAILLTCPPEFYDVGFDPDKCTVEFRSWDVILSHITNAALGALGFPVEPAKPSNPPVDTNPSPANHPLFCERLLNASTDRFMVKSEANRHLKDISSAFPYPKPKRRKAVAISLPCLTEKAQNTRSHDNRESLGTGLPGDDSLLSNDGDNSPLLDIPVATHTSVTLNHLFKAWDAYSRQSRIAMGDSQDGTVVDVDEMLGLEAKISREQLSKMKVVAQVDKKFIVTSISDELFVLDQHAVHERICLERLQADCYDINSDGAKIKSTIDLAPPKPLSITLQERNLIQSYEKQFKAWGFRLHFPEINFLGQGDDTPVSVWSLPSILAECQESAKDVLRILRNYLCQLQSAGGASTSIPLDITRKLNQKACKGAIRFGDALTIEQCETLLKQLINCKCPFQCAHGRPSIVPLPRHRLAHAPAQPAPSPLRLRALLSAAPDALQPQF